MRKTKETIPVYDISALQEVGQEGTEFIAERFSDYLQVHPNLHKAHGHSFYHLVLFTGGSGHHTIDFERFPVTTGQIYFMAPGQVHSWEFKGKIDGFVVNFSESLFNAFLPTPHYPETFPFFAGHANEGVIRLDKSSFAETIDLMEKLVAESKGRDLHYLDAARGALILLFILVGRQVPPEEEPAKHQKPHALLTRFRRLVNEHYRSQRLPKEYAVMLHVTPNYLNALCNELLGRSAGSIIRERILLEAKRQLVNIDESIAVIGYNLGFEDNSYFTKFFKKYTGKTPESFRREVQTVPV